jgi:hypothetical protein
MLIMLTVWVNFWRGGGGGGDIYTQNVRRGRVIRYGEET